MSIAPEIQNLTSLTDKSNNQDEISLQPEVNNRWKVLQAEMQAKSAFRYSGVDSRLFGTTHKVDTNSQKLRYSQTFQSLVVREKRLLISPSSKWKSAWDIFIAIVLVYAVAVLPLKIGNYF